ERLSDTSVEAAKVTQSLSINCSMTSLAMNSGYRFGSMQSSGMRHLGNLPRLKITKTFKGFCTKSDKNKF
ncbi:MAG: hypothetical protein O3C03_10585, partial [Proteobacteria bacterium]|nr:hypothetical protein [Pseudomonadota bacterium]